MSDASSHPQGWRPATYYPDPAIHALDPRFEKYWLKLSAVERLTTGLRWAEGPVWFGDGRYLLCSDIPNQRIIKWEEETGAVSIFRKPSNFANGNSRDRQGRLVTCEHGGRRDRRQCLPDRRADRRVDHCRRGRARTERALLLAGRENPLRRGIPRRA